MHYEQKKAVEMVLGSPLVWNIATPEHVGAEDLYDLGQQSEPRHSQHPPTKETLNKIGVWDNKPIQSANLEECLQSSDSARSRSSYRGETNINWERIAAQLGTPTVRPPAHGYVTPKGRPKTSGDQKPKPKTMPKAALERIVGSPDAPRRTRQQQQDRLQHRTERKEKYPCKFFKQPGGCKNGMNCRFVHE